MALTRSMLKGMNLTDEQVSAIIEAHTESTDALKKQRDEYKADAEKLQTVQKELDELRNGEDWKAKYKAKEKELADYRADVTSKETLAAKKAAFRKLLTAESIPDKFHDRIIKMTDFSGMELDGDTLKDADAQRNAIANDWGEYKAAPETRGANVETPPATGKVTRSRDEILAIRDTAERQKAIAENPEAFGLKF